MNKNNHEVMKEILIERKKILEEELKRLNSTKNSDPQGQDSADQASAAVVESLENSLQSTELQEYTMILKALEMIEKGTYGICIDCGLPIAEKRLRYYPHVTRRLLCQEAIEQDLQKPTSSSL
jgi:DnaK suppressor protein